ncbi:uncharacterized protein LAESUDRAFT_763496 [Laetiporus sulphureus 93-53]|uniref:Uncharacterized protein n=1 Tax=Laetiporus sulphureus 93-53 TaxID=1314785 RepID=A0A165BW56_9APHY|nr:uncharacterized protein LAESUDRAFT_763496 [Laetiporus sulphureus 93-53]KZT01759.1 hypothetical protein LAESUDRAFT_763496 [Laetiporus sulphureus 93-53]
MSLTVAFLQLTYNRKQGKVNYKGASLAKQLGLPQDTSVGEYEEHLFMLPCLRSVPVILVKKKAAATTKLQKKLKELAKKELAVTSHMLKILPYHFDLITTRTFKCAHIEDLKPEIEHF